MSAYRNSAGRTPARLKHAFYTYVGGSNNFVDTICFGEPKVTYDDIHFASVSWDKDIPHLTFHPENCKGTYNGKYLRRMIKDLEKAQYYLKPFLDDPYVLGNLSFVIQEVRKALTFEEGLKIRRIRDKYDSGGWEWLHSEKIPEIVTKLAVQYLETGSQRICPIWKHVAICSIYYLPKLEEDAHDTFVPTKLCLFAEERKMFKASLDTAINVAQLRNDNIPLSETMVFAQELEGLLGKNWKELAVKGVIDI